MKKPVYIRQILYLYIKTLAEIDHVSVTKQIDRTVVIL